MEAYYYGLILICTLISVAAQTNVLRMEKFAGEKRQKSGASFGFASYYQNNMVLQREPHRAIIWGYGDIGATVNISINVQDVYSTKVVKNQHGKGVWYVDIKPQPAGSTADIQGVHDNFGRLQWILLKNLLFGDVFVCSGQSNMAFTMSMVYNASEELDDTVNYPNIRLFTVAMNFSAEPLDDLIGIEQSWSIPSPETVGGKDWTYFSAVCWLYGKYLYDELKIPIGLISTTWGGTPIEPWSPPDVFKTCMKDPHETSHLYSANENDEFQGYWDNSQLWNAMVRPLVNMTIKGVLWYQGESNENHNLNLYQCMFPNMIKSWRKEWHVGSYGATDPDFPFGFVQIGDKTSTEGSFTLVRWHQTADYGYVPNPQMKNTFMAVAIDLPDNDSPYASVHTRDKQDVGHRLVLGALAITYHQTIVFEGPFPQKITENSEHEVILEYPTYQQLSVVDNNNFQICCKGNNCNVTDPNDSPKWSTTPITSHDEHSITLSSKKCSADFKFVDKVRYAWALTPCEFKNCSVYNTAGLPAPPFTLDVDSK